MATHYVNLDGATGAGDGTSPTDEAASFAALTLAADDTVSFRRGTSSRGVAVSSSLDGLTLTAHGAGDEPWIRGDIQIASGSWTDNADGTYKATLAAEPDEILYNIGTSVDASGRHYGFLTEVADAATCVSTDGSWAWEAGEVFVNPTAAMTAPTVGGDYSYTETGVDGGIDLSGDNCIVRNLRASFWTENTPDRGYCIRMEGLNALVEDCRADDGGYHALGVVTASPQNGVVRRCSLWGPSNSMFVAHSNGGDVTAKTYDLTFHVYSRLGIDGNPLANASFIAYYTHSAGSGEVTDLENYRTRFVGYGDADCNLFNADNCPTVLEAERHDAANYGVQFYDSEIINGSHIDIGNGSDAAVAWVRSKLNLADAANYPQADNDTAIRVFTTGQMLLEATAVHATLNGSTTDCVMYLRASSTAKLTLIYAQVTIDGTGTSSNSAVFDSNGWALTGGLRCYATVFAHPAGTNTSMFKLMGTSKFTPTEHTFETCVYYGIQNYRWAYGNTSYDETAEWLASVDTTGVSGTDPELSLVGGHYRPDAGGNLDTTEIPADELPAYWPTLGIGKRGFNRRYGAFQTGTPRHSVFGSPVFGAA